MACEAEQANYNAAAVALAAATLVKNQADANYAAALTNFTNASAALSACQSHR